MSQTLLSGESYIFSYAFWILGSVKVRFGQTLLYLMKNMSAMFLIPFWNLETISRPFYDFNKNGLWWDLLIPSGQYLSFLFTKVNPFKKREKLESYHHSLLTKYNNLVKSKMVKLFKNCWLISSSLAHSQCFWLYILVDQISWPNELWFKKYTKKMYLL